MSRVLLLIFIISGCSVLNPFSIKQIYEAFSVNDIDLSDKELEEIEYSYVIVEFNNNRALLPLTSIKEDGSYVWTFNEAISLETFKGRVTKTIGFSHDSEILSNKPGSKLDSKRDIFLTNPNSFITQRIETVKDNHLSEPVQCELENVVTLDFKWSFTNTFCFDSQGYPSITKQEIHPMIGKLRIEYFFQF